MIMPQQPPLSTMMLAALPALPSCLALTLLTLFASSFLYTAAQQQCGRGKGRSNVQKKPAYLRSSSPLHIVL